MGAYEIIGTDLDNFLSGVLEQTGCVVCALYRRNALGEYAPVFWVPRFNHRIPSHVSSASDVASRLRRTKDEPFVMECTTFKDGPVRRGLESFGVKRLYATLLPGDSSQRYYFTAGTADDFSEKDFEAFSIATKELSEALNRATLRARVRGSGLPAYRGDDTWQIPTFETKPNKTLPLSLMAQTVEHGSFSHLLSCTRDILSLPNLHIVVEDKDGLILAEAPNGAEESPTSHWLSLFQHLPYLDWMEDSRGPVFVPSTPNPSGPGRLVIPLFGRTNYHGLVSAYPITNEEIAERTQTFIELRLATMYLIRCREASRTHVLSRSLSSVENEQARIAVELHDETSQNLVALKVRLATAQYALERGDHEKATGIIEDCARISDEILDGVNRLAADLRPSELAYLGLRPAIEAAAETRLPRAGISYEIIGNAVDAHFGALQERMLLTGVVEAISNCARHSSATKAEIEMRDDGGWFSIAVRDNGRGYSPAEESKGGIGIKTMRDCSQAIGGYFWIGSEVGSGTTVRFSVPFEQLEEAGYE